MLKQTCLKIQRESMSLNIKNKSCYKQMIDIVNNKTIKKDVKPIESYYRHKVRNIYKQGPNKHKNIVQRQHISLRWRWCILITAYLEWATYKLAYLCKHTYWNKASRNLEKTVFLPRINKRDSSMIEFFLTWSVPTKLYNLKEKERWKSWFY